jgi:hypothetical protein
MRVLVACEYSGRVRDAFIKNGHYAMSCDLLPSDSPHGDHYQGDVFDIIDDGWDLLIGHPPCTYLCNSGVSHLHRDSSRREKMYKGAAFFERLLNATIPKVCIENPIMHKYAKSLIGRSQSQVIQPWMFGHPQQKATCLWLKNLPLLTETNNVKNQMALLPKSDRQKMHWLPPSKDRWKIRSTTYQGIADAMADQWGSMICVS